MHRILTFFVGLPWTVHFALLAIWSLNSSRGSVLPASEWFTVAPAEGPL